MYVHHQVKHGLDKVPARIELMFTKAERSAWAALALSEKRWAQIW
jgi:hypothetical protein